jgi:hypothetical protein
MHIVVAHIIGINPLTLLCYEVRRLPVTLVTEQFFDHLVVNLLDINDLYENQLAV